MPRGLVCLGLLASLLLPAGLPVAADLGHRLAHLSGQLSLEHLLQAPGHVHSHGAGPLHLHEDGEHGPRSARESAVADTDEHSGWHHPDAYPVSTSGGARPEEDPGSHDHHPAVEVLLVAADPGSGSEVGPSPRTVLSPDLHLPGDVPTTASGRPVYADPPKLSPPPPASPAAPALDPPPPRA